MSKPVLGDDVLVRRAARELALRAAVLVAVAMLLLIALVTLVVVRDQRAADNDLLRQTARTADDVGDPPPRTWIVLTHGDRSAASPGLPPALLPELAALRTASAGGIRLRDLSVDDTPEVRVATARKDGRVVQVVLDLAAEHARRNRLLKIMGAAAALGLALAGGLGILLGRRAVRPFAHALALQRTFVADASHELRTPLTLLSTRAQLLDQAVQASSLPEQARRDSAAVVDDVGRLGEVLEDLLLTADPRREQPREPVALDAIARAAVESARAHARAAGVELVLSDPGGEALEVLGAEPALRRALLALIDNAIDHTPAGGDVTVSCRRVRRDVVVTVADSGPGIAPDEAEDVLRRFHSGGQRSGRAHYGLGLALTHDVANRHGGLLRLAPSERGATFELVLPGLSAN